MAEKPAPKKQLARKQLERIRAFFARPIVVALTVACVVALWIISGARDESRDLPQATAITEQTRADNGLRVVARQIPASDFQNRLSFQGRTEAVRQVSLAAETMGVIQKLPAKKGTFVQKGQILCELETGARQAHYNEARALRAARRIDYNAARRLQAKGHASKSQIASAKAAYDAARAMATARKVELDRTKIRAPFDGILDDLPFFVGDFLNVGQPCAIIIDKDPLLITASVPENMITQIEIGARGHAKLATGETINGRIRYVAERPNQVTRTFLVELEVPNRDLLLRDGISAQLHIDAGNIRATAIPQGLLTLNNEGDLGVRVIENGIVVFRPTTIISSNAEHAWVTGLSETEMVITVGHEFVQAGQSIAFTLANDAENTPSPIEATP